MQFSEPAAMEPDDEEALLGEGPNDVEHEIDTEDALTRLLNNQQLSEADLLSAINRKLLAELLTKLEMGQASHQEMAIMRNLLRDNGVMLLPGARDLAERPANGQWKPPQLEDLPILDEPDYTP